MVTDIYTGYRINNFVYPIYSDIMTLNNFVCPIYSEIMTLGLRESERDIHISDKCIYISDIYQLFSIYMYQLSVICISDIYIIYIYQLCSI